jgi:hypothetical protein
LTALISTILAYRRMAVEVSRLNFRYLGY